MLSGGARLVAVVSTSFHDVKSPLTDLHQKMQLRFAMNNVVVLLCVHTQQARCGPKLPLLFSFFSACYSLRCCTRASPPMYSLREQAAFVYSFL